MTERALEALRSCLDCRDDETRFNAAYAINKLASIEVNITILGDTGFIPRLIDVVQTGGSEAMGQACACLRHLALLVSNRSIMLESNILEALGSVAVKNDIESLREIAACACLLTLTDIIRMPLVASSLMIPLIRMCGNEDVEVARQACGAIANTAESKRTHKRLVEVGKVFFFALNDNAI